MKEKSKKCIYECNFRNEIHMLFSLSLWRFYLEAAINCHRYDS